MEELYNFYNWNKFCDNCKHYNGFGCTFNYKILFPEVTSCPKWRGK